MFIALSMRNNHFQLYDQISRNKKRTYCRYVILAIKWLIHIRWLEDDRSEETEAWVRSENKVTHHYLDQIPFRKQIKDRMTKLWNYEKYSSPTRHGDYDLFL